MLASMPGAAMEVRVCGGGDSQGQLGDWMIGRRQAVTSASPSVFLRQVDLFFFSQS